MIFLALLLGSTRVPMRATRRSVAAYARGRRSSRPPSELIGSEHELRVGNITNLGDGVARLDDGRVVLVPFTLGDELVRARIYRDAGSYLAADLVDVIEPSPERIAPRCEHFGTCGGCQYQHMPLATQRAWKRQHVIDSFARIGGYGTHVVDLEALVRSTAGGDAAHAWHYRSKITPHHEAPRRGDASHDVGAIGFREATRRRLVDVTSCALATPAINAALPAARDAARARAAERARRADAARARGDKRRPKGATLLLRDADGGVETNPREHVRSTIAGVEFRFLAGEFFQNNPSALPLLLTHVAARASAEGALTHLVDAYCGGGFFALGTASKFTRVAGVEISEDNVVAARANAARNQVKHVVFEAGDAAALFAPLVNGGGGAEPFPPAETCVVIDPPRKGCDAAFLDQLFDFTPRRVVYVSCDPSTQARDAAAFLSAGYELREVLPFDLFPQTRHIEAVAVFDRRTPGDAPLPLGSRDHLESLDSELGAEVEPNGTNGAHP